MLFRFTDKIALVPNLSFSKLGDAILQFGRFSCHAHDIAVSFCFAKTARINNPAMSRV